MNNREIAVRIEGVKKQYKLGQIGGGTLQADLQSWWAKVRGKEDPNRKIGDNRIIGETFMALNGIDLTIYEGERVGIIGRNGAGKSTLLKLLARVTAPTEGDIDIYGRITSMLEVGTGFNGELTGRENIYMNGAILGMTKAEIDSKIEKIIDFSEVRQFIDTPVKRYSSGMYVKLAFAVASHLDSEILIMDEVLAVGDMAFQKKCLDKMSQVSQDEGRTILYVSHNMNTIRQLCDRCIVMDHGTIIFNGDVEEAIEIYLNNDKHEDLVVINLDEIKRDRDYLGKDAKLMYFQFVDKDKPVFQKGEKIRFRIRWQCKTKGIHYKVLIPIKSDGLTIIGSALSEILNDGQDQRCYDEVFEIDSRNFVEGNYSLIIALYGIDALGNEFMCDHSIVKIGFTIQRNETDPIWKKSFWGSINIPIERR